MARFWLNLMWCVYIFLHYGRIISMVLTPAQLQALQDGLDLVKAKTADTVTATATVQGDEDAKGALDTQYASDVATLKVQSDKDAQALEDAKQAEADADAAFVALVEADFNPPA